MDHNRFQSYRQQIIWKEHSSSQSPHLGHLSHAPVPYLTCALLHARVSASHVPSSPYSWLTHLFWQSFAKIILIFWKCLDTAFKKQCYKIVRGSDKGHKDDHYWSLTTEFYHNGCSPWKYCSTGGNELCFSTKMLTWVYVPQWSLPVSPSQLC